MLYSKKYDETEFFYKRPFIGWGYMPIIIYVAVDLGRLCRNGIDALPTMVAFLKIDYG